MKLLFPSARAVVLALSLLPIPAIAQKPSIEIIDVTSFGARNNGVTDDTSALRAAAEAVPRDGAILLFPKGIYAIKGTIYLKSHTHVEGSEATILATLPWHHDFPTGGALLENVHHDAAELTDTDISINGMTFDYGYVAPVSLPKGGKHAVRFNMTSHVAVTNNVFYLRGSEDAVAGIGVANILVLGNRAYEFRNCAYDFWGGSTDVHLYDNYAKTIKSAQMVNFNPDFGLPEDAVKKPVAKGFVMTGNTLITTGSSATAVLIAPLGPGPRVKDVVVARNKLVNTSLVVRGDICHAIITGNTLIDLVGGGSAITTYPFNGRIPNSIVFAYNVVVNPHTNPFEISVIRMQAEDSFMIGNSISGSEYTSGAYYHGKFNVTEISNTAGK